VVVVVEVVVSGMPSHGGSVGSVQEQFGFVLHSLTTACLQALKAMPVKAPHGGADLFRADIRVALPRRSCFGDKDARPERDSSQRDNCSPNHRHREAPPMATPSPSTGWSAARLVAATAREPTKVARTLARHLIPIIPKPLFQMIGRCYGPFGRPTLMSSSSKLRPRSLSCRRPVSARQDQSAERIAENPDYGRIVCHCEQVTRGEILDAAGAPVPVGFFPSADSKSAGGCRTEMCGSAR
jgi:hypothetical protein